MTTTRSAEFLQSFASKISDSSSYEILLPALLQVREKCLKTISEGTGIDTKSEKSLGCKWCLNSWSMGQYSVRLLPQKRPRGFRNLRAKFGTNKLNGSFGKRGHKYIGHNFLALKCDLCLGTTKIPAVKPIEVPKEATPSPPTVAPVKKKKKSKKKDDFAGLNPVAVKTAKARTTNRDHCDGKQVLNVFEVLSPSSIQNGANIVSNRSNKNRSQASASGPEKSIIKQVGQAQSLKLPSHSKSKKKKKTGSIEKPKKTKNVTSALATFLNSL